jgi:amidase
MAQAIRNQRVSSESVVSACLQRIKQVNPQLNAVVRLRADEALADAKGADEVAKRRLPMGPLHGVPMTIKDSFDTAGLISTGGTMGRASFVPSQDATVVARLKAAGAILLGKTNTPEFTLGIITNNIVFGRTNNPYDVSRSCGGSSGGAAAIVAAKGSAFDIGSDTGGSIRLPAHFCGIAGLKPTSGRVPRTGHIVSFGGIMDGWTQIGPLARYVSDLALLLPILTGSDWHDPSIVDMPVLPGNDVDIKGLKIAVFNDNGIDRVTGPVENAVRKAASALATAGAIIEETKPPQIEKTEQVFMSVGFADGGAWIRRMVERAGTHELSAGIKWWTTELKPVTAAELTAAVEAMDQYRSSLLLFMQKYDAILCPVEAYSALSEKSMLDRDHATTYTLPFNLTGQPVVVVRADTSPEGLPIGVQIAARRWREDVALALAERIEAALGGWKAPMI